VREEMENSLQQLHEANEQCRHANAHNKGFTVSQSGSPKPFELRGRSEVYVHVFVLDFFYCVYMPVYVYMYWVCVQHVCLYAHIVYVCAHTCTIYCHDANSVTYAVE
jgi:hypothetical protein